MSSLLRNRPLFIGAGTLLVVLVGALLYARSRPTQLGDVTMLKLAGWEQRTMKTRSSLQVNYRKLYEENRLYIGLTKKIPGTMPLPKTLSDLKNEAIKGGAGATRTMKFMKMQFKFAPPQTIQLGTIPAVTTTGTIKTPKDVTFGKSLFLLKGSDYYILTANITVPSPIAKDVPPEAQSHMDKALTEVTNALQSAS